MRGGLFIDIDIWQGVQHKFILPWWLWKELERSNFSICSYLFAVDDLKYKLQLFKRLPAKVARLVVSESIKNKKLDRALVSSQKAKLKPKEHVSSFSRNLDFFPSLQFTFRNMLFRMLH